jgi:hypothetical protein
MAIQLKFSDITYRDRPAIDEFIAGASMIPAVAKSTTIKFQLGWKSPRFLAVFEGIEHE